MSTHNICFHGSIRKMLSRAKNINFISGTSWLLGIHGQTSEDLTLMGSRSLYRKWD